MATSVLNGSSYYHNIHDKSHCASISGAQNSVKELE